jgi:hypothetical protein
MLEIASIAISTSADVFTVSSLRKVTNAATVAPTGADKPDALTSFRGRADELRLVAWNVTWMATV